jgi:hypothetical protein
VVGVEGSVVPGGTGIALAFTAYLRPAGGC